MLPAGGLHKEIITSVTKNNLILSKNFVIPFVTLRKRVEQTCIKSVFPEVGAVAPQAAIKLSEG
jgi:hypothetical protein